MEHRSWETPLNNHQRLHHQNLSPPPRGGRWKFFFNEKLQAKKNEGESIAPKNGTKGTNWFYMLRSHKKSHELDWFYNDWFGNENRPTISSWNVRLRNEMVATEQLVDTRF